MSIYGKETRSAFRFHKPGNNATVICTAALDVRWYSISEEISFSLCKVSFLSHLKVFVFILKKKKKRKNYETLTHISSTLYWNDCLISSSLYYLSGVYLTYLRAYYPYIFILFYSLYIFPSYNNLIVNNHLLQMFTLNSKHQITVYLTSPSVIGYLD